MLDRGGGSEKIQSLAAGSAGGAALYHYANYLGLGLDKDVVGHIAPLASFFMGWIWVVFYQETFGRINLFRLKKACRRRISEIDADLLSANVPPPRRTKLVKERDDCLEIIEEASRHDLKSRLRFSLSN